jgi:hypothetical protein
MSYFVVATGWTSGVQFPAGARNVSLLHSGQVGSGAHPASYPMGVIGSFPEIERPGSEADHLPPSSAEFKNGGATLTIPQYFFMECCLINYVQR